MSEPQRIHKSLKNAKVALMLFSIEVLLSFIARKAFIDYLGAEVLGLNTICVNILNFLNLAELGLSSAISFSLYKPIYDGDREEINNIISLQGYLYKKISFVILGASCILLLFFPFIFEKSDVVLWYPYATFFVLLFSALLGYLFNYKQILLVADMKEYKVLLSFKGCRIIKTLLQIVCIVYFSYGYLFWLVIEFVNAIVTTLVLRRVIRRSYPWLNTTISRGKELKVQYSIIVKKTKQLFFHKIATFALQQMSPLIIYYFLSLTVVAIYGNYQLIMIGCITFFRNIYIGVRSAVGNVVAEGNINKIFSSFVEIFVSQFWLASILAYMLYIVSPGFITIWFGGDYLLLSTTLIIMVLTSFILMIRSTIDNFIQAYGLYHDVWAPVVECIINISLSFILGYVWGIDGILLGVLISLIVVVMGWKPLFLFSNGFKKPVSKYIVLLLKCSFLSLLSILISYYSATYIGFESEGNIGSLLLYSLMHCAIFTIAITLLFFIFIPEMRLFCRRVLGLISKSR